MRALHVNILSFFFLILLSIGCKKSSPSKPKVLTVSTLAGSGTAGASNGTGTSASFTSPSDLAIGSNGILYVGDWGNSLIRSINVSTNAVSTFAGNGTVGLLNGQALSAEFNGTAHIVFDGQGDMLVADEENNVIREISPSGTVTTLAGSGVQGYQDGPLATAEFSHPEEMVLDANGNIYVADGINLVIRKITLSTGMVSTYAGVAGVSGMNNGPVASATFSAVYGMTMDASGNIYVPDIGNNVIRLITVSSGMVSTFAGSGAQGLVNGAASSASFYYPIACHFDNEGNLYVADLFNNCIRLINSSGVVSTYAGSGIQGNTNGPVASASFYHPIAVIPDNKGNVYVADEYNNEIRVINEQPE